MTALKKIEEWQVSRKLDTGWDQWVSLRNHLEELFEGIGFGSLIAKHLSHQYCDMIKEEWTNGGSPEPSIEDIVDSRCDKIVFAVGDLLKLGYTPELCLLETYQEINSRKQSPVQAHRWNNGGYVPGEKWQKDISQEPSTLYVAKYDQCLRCEDDNIKAELEELREDLLQQVSP